MLKRLSFALAVLFCIFHCWTAMFGAAAGIGQKAIHLGLVLIIFFLDYLAQEDRKWYCRVMDAFFILKSPNVVEFGFLEHCLREDLNATAERTMAVLRPIKPVSYTHLDVYKRQMLTTPTAWRSCSAGWKLTGSICRK